MIDWVPVLSVGVILVVAAVTASLGVSISLWFVNRDRKRKRPIRDKALHSLAIAWKSGVSAADCAQIAERASSNHASMFEIIKALDTR